MNGLMGVEGMAMGTLFERIRAAVPGAIFYPGATEEQIGRVEGALGVRFPGWLRELYLCCNGIQEGKFRDPYLYALEKNDDFQESLLSWNEFIRGSWQENAPHYKQNFPETDWDFYDPRHLLLIGGSNGDDWGVDLRTNSAAIVRFDVRNPDSREVIAKDLVQMFLKDRLFGEKIHREIYCGRAPYRREAHPLPATSDVDFILDMLIEICRGSRSSSLKLREAGSPGWRLYRGISQREAEGGMLFLFEGGPEVQVATVDGNLPFVMRRWGSELAASFFWGFKTFRGSLFGSIWRLFIRDLYCNGYYF